MPTTGALEQDSAGQKFMGPFDASTGTGKAARGANIDSTTGYADFAVVLYDDNNAILARADDAAFAVGTRRVMPIGALADETSPDAVDEGDVGIPRMTLSRVLRVVTSSEGGVSAVIVDDAAFTAGTTPIHMIGAFADETSTDQVDEGDGGAVRMSLSRVLLASPTAKTGAAASIVDDAAFTAATDAVVMLGGFADETSTDQVDEGDGGAVRMSLSRVLLVSPTAKTGAAASIVDDAAFTVTTDAVVMIGALADETSPDAVDEGDAGALRMTLSRVLRVVNSADGGGSSVIVDDAAFTPATTAVQMLGAFADETSTDQVDEGDGGAVRMSLSRVLLASPTAKTGAAASILDDAAFTVGTDAVVMSGFLVDDTSTDSADEGDGGAARMSADRVLYSGSATKAVVFSFTSPSSATTVAETAVTGLGPYRSMSIYAALTGATGGTLDIYLQYSPDLGTTWVDYAHWAQIAAGASVIYRVWNVTKEAQQTTVATVGTGTSPALAANTIIGGNWGDRLRIVSVAGASTSAGAAQVILAVLNS